MTASSIPLNQQQPHWQATKYLKSGDRVWFLTDVESFASQFHPYSEPQTLFKVGIYDLDTGCVGFAVFGKDIAGAVLRAGVVPPPWVGPRASGVAVIRMPHVRQEKGRFVVRIELVALDDAAKGMLPVALRKLKEAGHSPNATTGTWDQLQARATREAAIEAAAMAMVGPFSAGDVKRAIGDLNADVTSALQRLVAEGKLLPPTGKNRSTRYEVAPIAIVARADWTD